MSRDRLLLIAAALALAALGLGRLLLAGERPVRLVLAAGAVLFGATLVRASYALRLSPRAAWAVCLFALAYTGLHLYRLLIS